MATKLTPRMWLPLFLLCFALLASTCLAARADHTASSGTSQNVIPIPPPLIPDGGPNEQLPYADKAPAMGIRGPEENFVGFKVGSTWYDKQHNGTVGRNIAMGSDGRIHFFWMHKPSPTGMRSTFYNSAIFQSGQWLLSHDTSGVQVSGTNGGYCNIDVWGDLAVPAWHEGATENTYTIYSGIDLSSGSGDFATSAAPIGSTCSGNTTNGEDGAGNYLWPIHHVDVGYANDPVVHAVGNESSTSVEQSFVYIRGTSNPIDWASCATFVDSVTDIAGVVRQDPNSDKVAIVWVKPRDYGPDENQYDNNLVYSESVDGGITWGGIINVTNHVDEDLERPYTNLSAMYTSDGCLHIVWDSPGYFKADGTVSVARCRMRHWDDCSGCFSEVVNAQNAQTCTPGEWERNVTKMNLAECDGKLYVVYTYYTGDTSEGTVDCSQGGWANGELYASVSSTSGQTWGEPVNLTNTFSNGCTAGNCQSETYSSTVMYADSLYTSYVGDTDAGDIPADEGSWTECPIMFMVNPCFDMSEWVELSAEPAAFAYPFHVAQGGGLDTTFTLYNAGNVPANYSASVNYISGSGWLSVDPATGSVPIGCANDIGIGMSISAPMTAGLYEAEINIDYGRALTTVPVSLYVFDDFDLPETVRLRTASCALGVQQQSRIGVHDPQSGIFWFIDSTSYLADGSLIIGNSRDNLSLAIYHDAAEVGPPENPWKRLYAYSEPSADSTSFNYRIVSGSGVNFDSTIAFDIHWYAPKHPDSSQFFVGHFNLHPGPSWSAPVENVVIAFAADFDVPSDTTADNLYQIDSSAGMQYMAQQGQYPGSANDNDLRYGGIAYRGNDSSSYLATGARIWDNKRYVYEDNGYNVDSLWKYLPNQTTWEAGISPTDTNTDLNSIIVVRNNETIDADYSLEFNIVLWSTNPHESKSSLDVEQILRQANRFICDYVSPDAPWCYSSLCGSDNYTNCIPGDADGNGTVNITDAVYVIEYIFVGGPAPRPWTICSGDMNGDCMANITDCIVIIQWIFVGGYPPLTCEDWLLEECDDPGDFNPGPWE